MGKIIISLAICLLIVSVPLAGASQCDLAKTVAGKAAQAFTKDQGRGLKLFIKAQQLCPDNAALNYNLGLAYYQYGSLNESQRYLQKAVKLDGSKGLWLNNLATVSLELGDTDSALSYAKKAVDKLPNTDSVKDTLCRVMLATGDYRGALSGIKQAQQQWRNDKTIQRTYDEIVDGYVSYYLQKIKQGDIEKGLSGLKVAKVPEASKAYCTVLAKLGRGDEALTAVTAVRGKYSNNTEIEQCFNDIVDQVVRGFYLDFKAGKSGQAVAAVKELSEQYPTVKPIKKAYDELLDAFLADATSITVPEAAPRIATSQRRQNRSDNLLADIGGSSVDDVELDLTVDVDEIIPRGNQQRPNAIAVVIGNQHYQRQGKGIGDVRYAGRDADVMRKYLITTLGFDAGNIIFSHNATSGDLRNIFGTSENPRGRLHNYLRGGESEVFIYYVGHGAPGPDGKSAYLVPVDARADYIANNGYPLDHFYRMLENLPAKNITVVLDACFSGDSPAGTLFDKISPAMVKNIQPVRQVANTVIFSSADKDQVSTWYPEKRHSMFTYWFLKGLGGAADSDSDQSVTAQEMEQYLGKEVKYWAQRKSNRVQTPLMLGSGATVLARLK